MEPSAVAVRAGDLGLELLKSEDVNADADRERIVAATEGVGWASICAFGQLIREPLLSEAPMLNVHPSLLPKWRGAAPIERSLMAGDRETGVSVMKLVAGLDSGPVALVETTPIGEEEDFGELSGRLAGIGGDLLARALDLAVRESIVWVEQDDSEATYAEKVESPERQLDPTRSAAECHDLVRALTPHIGAWVGLEGNTRLGVTGSRLDPSTSPSPGTFVDESGRLLLGCADCALELTTVKPEGRSEMDAASYLRGYGVPSSAT